MKLLLVNPAANLAAAMGRFQGVYHPMPPINLAYLAAACSRRGIKVSVFDECAGQGGPDELRRTIVEQGPDVVGMGCLTQTAVRVAELSRLIKSIPGGPKVVLGNLHAGLYAEEFLTRGLADAVVHNEGEQTLPELIQALAAGRDLGSVMGLSHLAADGAVAATGPRPFVEDLDTLPFPAWSLFPLERYSLFGFASIKKPGTIILGSRGCPYGCTFCSLLTMGRRRRARSAENLVEEFDWLNREFGYRQISFVDAIHPLTKAEGLAFCREMTARRLHERVVWSTETRVDLVDEELLGAMSAAGCKRMMYGIETGSDGGLDRLGKGFVPDRTRAAVELTRRAGMDVIGFFMIGIPDETEQEIAQTIDYARKLDIDFAKFNIMVPYPGTAVFDSLAAEGELDCRDWDRYTSFPTPANPPAFVPRGLSAERLMELQRRAVRAFYLRPKTVFRHLFRLRTVGLGELWKGFLSLLGR